MGLQLTVAMLATTLPSSLACSEGLPAPDPFEELDKLTSLVRDGNACALPGIDIKYYSFLGCMWAAVRAGFVEAA